MAELQTPDGKPADPGAAGVNLEFDRAMAADQPEHAAPPKRAEPAEQPKRKRGRPSNADKARLAAAAAAAPLSREERAQGVQGLVQVGAGLALVAHRVTGSDAFKADAVTLATSAAEWGEAAASVAAADPKFARLVDKVAAAGPYGALIQVAMATGLQLARNHRPDAKLPGTVPPADLLAQSEQQDQAAAAAERLAA